MQTTVGPDVTSGSSGGDRFVGVPTAVYFSGGLKLEVDADIDEVRDRLVGADTIIELETEHGRRVYVRRELVAYVEERPERPSSAKRRFSARSEDPAGAVAPGGPETSGGPPAA